MANKLNEQNASALSKGVIVPSYSRSDIEIGLVHFGPGAFHRAHQAVYTDSLLELGHTQWGICEVSIHSTDFRDAMQAQDNLYTLSILDEQCSQRVIGAIKEVLVAPENPQAVIERLSQAQVKAVTLTITEKGYCLTPQGELDFSHEGIVHDLNNLASPKTAIGFLVAGLQTRYSQGIEPFAAISCDNLSNNGRRLEKAIQQFCQRLDPLLAQWVESHGYFPNTMVDSITPATTNLVRDDIEEKIGVRDEWPIQREAFTQWVIEAPANTQNLSAQLPPWDLVGAIFSDDVNGYEESKLRILNGMHSSLAFIGLISGFDSVEQAIKDRTCREFITQLLYNEILPTLKPVKGLDMSRYAADIVKRFENPSIVHQLSQIAWDSSQKIPFRILATIEDNLNADRASPGLCKAIAAWICLLEKMILEKQKIVDPLADMLTSIISNDGVSDQVRINNVLGLRAIFPQSLFDNPRFSTLVFQAYSTLSLHQLVRHGLRKSG